MIFERVLLGCAELRFLPGRECPRLPEPLGAGARQGGWAAAMGGEGRSWALVAGGALSPVISQGSYLPRGPDKFTALPLALTLGTLVWQIMKTKRTQLFLSPLPLELRLRVASFLQAPTPICCKSS